MLAAPSLGHHWRQSVPCAARLATLQAQPAALTRRALGSSTPHFGLHRLVLMRVTGRCLCALASQIYVGGSCICKCPFSNATAWGQRCMIPCPQHCSVTHLGIEAISGIPADSEACQRMQTVNTPAGSLAEQLWRLCATLAELLQGVLLDTSSGFTMIAVCCGCTVALPFSSLQCNGFRQARCLSRVFPGLPMVPFLPSSPCRAVPHVKACAVWRPDELHRW